MFGWDDVVGLSFGIFGGGGGGESSDGPTRRQVRRLSRKSRVQARRQARAMRRALSRAARDPRGAIRPLLTQVSSKWARIANDSPWASRISGGMRLFSALRLGWPMLASVLMQMGGDWYVHRVVSGYRREAEANFAQVARAAKEVRARVLARKAVRQVAVAEAAFRERLAAPYVGTPLGRVASQKMAEAVKVAHKEEAAAERGRVLGEKAIAQAAQRDAAAQAALPLPAPLGVRILAGAVQALPLLVAGALAGRRPGTSRGFIGSPWIQPQRPLSLAAPLRQLTRAQVTTQAQLQALQTQTATREEVERCASKPAPRTICQEGFFREYRDRVEVSVWREGVCDA